MNDIDSKLTVFYAVYALLFATFGCCDWNTREKPHHDENYRFCYTLVSLMMLDGKEEFHSCK